MRAVLQRVTRASVTVDGEVLGKIGKGFMILLGVENYIVVGHQYICDTMEREGGCLEPGEYHIIDRKSVV